MDYGFRVDGQEGVCRNEGQMHVAEEEAVSSVRPHRTNQPRGDATESDLFAPQAMDVSLLLYISGLYVQSEPVRSVLAAVRMLHQSQRCTRYRWR